MQRIQTLRSLDHTPKIYFVINNSGSDKLEYSEKGPPVVDFDAAEFCCLYVTTMKAMNFQDAIPIIPIDDFKDHYVLVLDLTSMQDAAENRHYPELVAEQLRLELNFTFAPEQVTELIVLGD